MSMTKWRISGDHYDICSCDVICPCGPAATPPTKNGVCEAVLGFHINEGNYGTTSLVGANFLLAVTFTGVITEGNWTVGVYVDDKLSKEQKDALVTIVSGKAGGPPQAIGKFIGKLLGVKFVPITLNVEGKKHSWTAPGIFDASVEPLSGANPAQPVELSNTPYGGLLGLTTPITVARSSRNSYTDKEWKLEWDNAGQSTFMSKFTWSGP